MDKGAWQAAAHEVANSWKRLSTRAGYFIKLKVIINIGYMVDSKEMNQIYKEKIICIFLFYLMSF